MSLPSTKPSLSSTQSPEQMNAFPFVKGECCNCGVKDRWLLHNVVVRGVDRRICTSCVLRLHPSSFCPCCFEFYENPYSLTSATSAHRFVSCVKCSSLSHVQCLSSSPPPSSFLCPPCSQPKFTFFPVPEFPVDEKLAKIFLCACKIASAAMKKQAAASTVRSDRAVKESALARKKAKEALEHVFTIERLRDSYDLANNNVVCKKEDFNDFGGGQGQGQPQSQNVALNNKIGSNGSSVVVNKFGANGNDGRIGNNGGRFGAALKTSVL